MVICSTYSLAYSSVNLAAEKVYLGEALCVCLRDTSSFANGFLQFPLYAWVPGVPLHALQICR